MHEIPGCSQWYVGSRFEEPFTVKIPWPALSWINLINQLQKFPLTASEHDNTGFCFLKEKRDDKEWLFIEEKSYVRMECVRILLQQKKKT